MTNHKNGAQEIKSETMTSTVSATEKMSSKKILNNLIKKIKRAKLLFAIFNAALVMTAVLLLLNPFNLYIINQFLVASITLIFSSRLFVRSTGYYSINKDNLLEHLNRKLAHYQESAQLLSTNPDQNVIAKDKKTLTKIQEFQKSRVEELLRKDYQNNRLDDILPSSKIRTSVFLVVVIAILLVAKQPLSSLYSSLFTTNQTNSKSPTAEDLNSQKPKGPQLIEAKILVLPPKYTNLARYEVEQLDLEIPQGSTLSWSLQFSHSNLDYYLHLTNKNKQLFIQRKDRFELSQQINQTSLYRLSFEKDNKDGRIRGINTITVIPDDPPKIKILQPLRRLLEITQQDPAEFNITVQVSDDYAISSVKILASVAKGSGESVKFRDKEFRFKNIERHVLQNGSMKNIYTKRWLLSDLDMQPGDEVYFSILASDNKTPVKQNTKSSSVIVRWLDEQPVEMGASGIKIGFIAEYFRSQRQIIIETEQLIADRLDLHDSIFNDQSTDLGHSQNDLKQKYGQYLGDEFGEGIAESIAENLETTDNQQQPERESTEGSTVKDLPAADEHDHNEETLQTNQIGNADALIQQFTHQHGSTEIGPISTRDPKSWMKMAVSEMWQAELHLMLSEPELAIAFEEKAYKYLKLATQAERIYAKRLGFEPPPVNEDRRLTGELVGIIDRDLAFIDLPEKKSLNALLKRAYKVLNIQSPISSQSILNKQQLVIFHDLSNRLLALAKERPALVKYAAIAEQVAFEKSLFLQLRNDCILKLKKKIWQMLPEAISRPEMQFRHHGLPTEATNEYLRSIQRLNRSND